MTPGQARVLSRTETNFDRYLTATGGFGVASRDR